MSRGKARLGLAHGVLLALAGCASAGFAEGSGRGLVSADRTAPPGVETFARPTWQLGDRFVFRRGGQLRLEYSVTVAGADGYELREETNGLLHRIDADLGQLSQELPGEPDLARVLAPVDPQFHWPLWAGKQWTGHYLRKSPDGAVVPILVHYHCDLREPVTVPAGTFDALRIWRRTRPALEGTFLDQHELVWYAPAVGYVVRRLGDNTLTELEEYQRQS